MHERGHDQRTRDDREAIVHEEVPLRGSSRLQPRVLVLSWVFPNHAQPIHGPFVLARMQALAKRAELRVIAPIPWLPFGHVLASGTRPKVDRKEIVGGIRTYHPLFFRPPGESKTDALTYYLGVRRLARRIYREWPFDVIDAHFGYPDGRAATMLGRELGVPVVITLRGLLNDSPRGRVRRPAIMRGLHEARAILSVSQSLKDAAVQYGVPEDKVTVASNGVDSARFTPLSRSAARDRLGIDDRRSVLISVGHLSRRKGFHRVIELLPELIERIPHLLFVIVGGNTYGNDRDRKLLRLADDLGVADHVLVAGPRLNSDLPVWLSAADVFCLMTEGEGWANVFLEALACGLPVVTTNVGGNAEVISNDGLGFVVELSDRQAMRDRLLDAFERDWDREALRAHALEHSWDRTADRVMGVWTGVIDSVGAVLP